jgi:hypothetical protein
MKELSRKTVKTVPKKKPVHTLTPAFEQSIRSKTLKALPEVAFEFAADTNGNNGGLESSGISCGIWYSYDCGNWIAEIVGNLREEVSDYCDNRIGLTGQEEAALDAAEACPETFISSEEYYLAAYEGVVKLFRSIRNEAALVMLSDAEGGPCETFVAWLSKTYPEAVMSTPSVVNPNTKNRIRLFVVELSKLGGK